MSRQRWIAAAVIVVIALAAVWGVKSRSRRDAPRYRTAPVERGPIESLVSATGTVRPVEQVEVGSQVSGTVYRLFADYNDRVRKGQVLCQLEPSSFRARVAQAEAAVARAEAAVKDARRQLERARELIVQNYVSQAEVEAAEVQLEQRQAELKQARAQLQAARVDDENSTIRAPIDGVVIARAVDLGQTVAASLQAPRLFVIANDLSQMQVETRIDEADIGSIHPGLPARFTVDAFPDFPFRGQVAQVRLEPIVEQGVVTYTTIIRTQNPDLKLRPGMTANVSVLVARSDDALKVPNAALRFRPPAVGKARGGLARAEVSPGGRGARAGGGEAARGGLGREDSRDGPGSESREAAGARGGERGSGVGTDSSGEAPGRRRRMAQGRDGPWGGRAGMRAGGSPADSGAGIEQRLKPGSVYVLRDGKPVAVDLEEGLTDGAYTEVRSGELHPGDLVVVGLEVTASGANLQPPPGMGGPSFGPGGGRGGGRGGGGRR